MILVFFRTSSKQIGSKQYKKKGSNIFFLHKRKDQLKQKLWDHKVRISTDFFLFLLQPANLTKVLPSKFFAIILLYVINLIIPSQLQTNRSQWYKYRYKKRISKKIFFVWMSNWNKTYPYKTILISSSV